ncbi:MAG: HAD family hydrolase [Methanothrix sp.]|uniref:HAD family hydrolase n=1 Tax=Methanothrix sp. TaxID=90426 RepID=UPI0025FF10BA|nr:HAD family hydrolase [Methanothrix sp.]MBK7386182.1 HAD family hydrolase [Methanothrix sp.]
MSGDLAVVMDVAGTIMRMYRVAKDISRNVILEGVVTWELIMEKSGRALVVPQMDPDMIISLHPEEPVRVLATGREECIKVSCSSGRVSADEALEILKNSPARMRDLQEACAMVKAKCEGSYHTAGFIIDRDLGEIVYAMSTGGIPFPGLEEALLDLEAMGADIYLASGDSRRSLSSLADLGIEPSRMNPVANPQRKGEIVRELKRSYRQVVMVGDGLNDIYALRAADLGVLTVEQQTRPSTRLLDAADVIIKSISDLPGIIERSRSIERDEFIPA